MPLPSSPCIFCRGTVETGCTFKKREHVVQQAFGHFERSLVLKCVCDACNSSFGDTIDRSLARDSAEGTARFVHGVKDPSEYRGLGRASRSFVESADTWTRGLKGHWLPGAAGGPLRMKVFPQIGFRATGATEFVWFHLTDVPTPKELRTLGFAEATRLDIQVAGVDQAQALELLEQRGWPKGIVFTDAAAPEGAQRFESVHTVDEETFRAATKVAINYFAYTTGAVEALHPLLDRARAFCMVGKRGGGNRAYAYENPHLLGHSGHYVSVDRRDDMIVVQFSLHLLVQYVVVLADDASKLRCNSTAHFFDLRDMTVREIEPLPLRPGRPLTRKERPTPSEESRP